MESKGEDKKTLQMSGGFARGKAWEKNMEEEELSRKQGGLLKAEATSADPVGQGSAWGTEWDSSSNKQTALSLGHSCL